MWGAGGVSFSKTLSWEGQQGGAAAAREAARVRRCLVCFFSEYLLVEIDSLTARENLVTWQRGREAQAWHREEGT